MLLAPAIFLDKVRRMHMQLHARRRQLCLESPAAADKLGGAGGEGAPEPPASSLVDLSSLQPRHPAHFYLPGDSAAMEALSDCFAIVGGRRLPLHGQLLAAQAAVLRELFVAQADVGATGSQSPVELTSALSGCSLLEAATFLRLIYQPDHATPASLAAVHAHGGGLLGAVAGLAHRLDAGGLLAKVEGYLKGAAATADISELLRTVRLAEACHLDSLADNLLSLLARQLAAAGPFWREQVRQEQLAGCTSESLASLACKMAGMVHAGAFEPPAVHGVLTGHQGAAGGFTWVIPRFSKQQGRVTSPWVEVGGVQWRLKVWPRGDDAAGGTHLSAYLECNYAQAQALGLASIESFYDFTFLDQSEEELHHSVDCGKDVFTANTQNWGKTRMMPLEELARQDRSYLKQDRLAVRISIRVLPPAGSGTAAAASAGLPLPVVAPPVPPAPAAAAGAV